MILTSASDSRTYSNAFDYIWLKKKEFMGRRSLVKVFKCGRKSCQRSITLPIAGGFCPKWESVDASRQLQRMDQATAGNSIIFSISIIISIIISIVISISIIIISIITFITITFISITTIDTTFTVIFTITTSSSP